MNIPVTVYSKVVDSQLSLATLTTSQYLTSAYFENIGDDLYLVETIGGSNE